MSDGYALALPLLLLILTLAAYIDRVYSEMGKFLAREYQDNIDAWNDAVEPRLHLGRESNALSASVLRQLSLAALALLAGMRLYSHAGHALAVPPLGEIARTVAELILFILVFDRLLPQILFTRTNGLWIARLRYLVQALFYLILPVTLLLGLLLSIAALAEPEDSAEEEHPSEAMDALLEAGEEEGILEESDRELVRSVVEFGDKVVREVMTPRPEIYAVDGSLTLQQFTAALEEHVFSRVPVYSANLDTITGIAFAHDLLQVADTEAAHRTVAQLQRPAAFVPETKKVNELLREMQREKQHMRIVIDEYGGVAGLVTIEDLIEAIVGNISDEHDDGEPDDEPLRQPDGSFIVSGTFELSRLRDLFEDDEDDHGQDHASDHAEAAASSHESSTVFTASPSDAVSAGPSSNAEQDDLADRREDRREDQPTDRREEHHPLRLPEHYESTTLGGLVSELAGHIPLPGEVVEEDGLRLEVLASTDRRVERVRVALTPTPQ
jgi:CBS domain containing-hemolysin-like protein